METSRKLLALFPGQGSQKVGMGAELAKTHDLAKRYFDHADEALGYSLSKLCFEGPAEQLNLTQNTQPAILTVSVVCYELFKESVASKFHVVAGAGHSLGEYSALVAAGALRFEDAVLLVHKRGKYMQNAVPAGQGKMIAIIGLEVPEIEAAIQKASTVGVVQIANLNAPGQTVVAGQAAAVQALSTELSKARIIELPVSAPFHCPLMKPAEEELAKDLANINIKPAQFPIYSNYFAEPLTEPEKIREALRLQVCGRVRWIECMQNAIKAHAPQIAAEFGTGNVLTGMLKRIDGTVPRANVDSAEAARKI